VTVATQVGTVKVPGLIIIEAGTPLRAIGTAEFVLEFDITGSPSSIGAHTVTVNPDGPSMRASMAKALLQAANDIETQGWG
jgi:hypothetical protein